MGENYIFHMMQTSISPIIGDKSELPTASEILHYLRALRELKEFLHKERHYSAGLGAAFFHSHNETAISTSLRTLKLRHEVT